jgi:hypothetical protein
MLLILVNFLPLMISLAIWFLYWRRRPLLPTWRLSLLLIGMTLSLVSSGVLAALWVQALTGHSKAGDLTGSYPVLTMWGLGTAGLILAFFGTGAVRWLLAINSVLLFVMWYLGMMAASV